MLIDTDLRLEVIFELSFARSFIQFSNGHFWAFLVMDKN